MPLYEFFCDQCEKKIEIAISVEQYEKKEWICSICRTKLRRLYSKVTIFVKRPEILEKEARKWMLGDNYGKEEQE